MSMEQQTTKRPKWMRVLYAMLWSVLAIGTISLLIASADSAGNRVCQGVKVQVVSKTLDSSLFREEIMHVAQLAFGKSFDQVRTNQIQLQRIEQHLKKDSWLQDAQLYFDNEAVLHMHIVTKNPIIRVYDTSLQSYYVDGNGHMLPYKSGHAIRLPVVTGVPFGYGPISASDSAYLHAIAGLGAFIQRDSFWMAIIDQINVTPGRSIELIPKMGGLIVDFGELSDIETKFEKLRAFYKHTAALKKWGAYSKISLQYRDQVVAVLRDQQEVMVDSAASLRIMQEVALKARILSADTALQKQTERTDQSTDTNMITQSVEREMPVENTTVVMTTPVSTARPATQSVPLKPAPTVPVKTTVLPPAPQPKPAAKASVSPKPIGVTPAKPPVGTNKPVNQPKPAVPPKATPPKQAAPKPATKPTGTVAKPPPKPNSSANKPPAPKPKPPEQAPPNNDY